MINGYKCLIGTFNSQSFVRLAVGKDASLHIKTDMIETSSAVSGFSREYLANEAQWSMSASSLILRDGVTISKGSDVCWAIDMDGEIYCGQGAVSSITWSGGIQGKGTMNIEISGIGHIWSNVVLDDRWILADASWNDNGIWLDLEFWKN